MSKAKDSTNDQATISNARILAECALMLAVGIVLSLVKIIDLPYGGAVTVASMLPVIIISYRHGIKTGLITGLAFGIIQQLLGLKNLTYVTTWVSILAVILLDYIIAFAVIGLGGLFRKIIKSQPAALVAGTILACVLRYACHVISGATVWAGLSIPTNAALIYSFGYNATYMIPETIVTAVLAYYLGSLIDFRNPTIRHMVQTEKTKVPLLYWTGGLAIAAAIIVDISCIFSNLQNADTGKFDFSGLGNVNWMAVIIATAAGAV
ncbi:MAG: energy-coupled thiamine transporter ThiT, partial [Lachnospiraceae bacterium]|nr:energy-coupled thiamine transporter ThiT [Lachnospiraceae bacterium]